jgi:xanthine dehydrogenase accessory factor
MDSIDVQVLRDAKEWLTNGYDVSLVTVTKTWGSSPRPIGAMLALRGDGLVSGSVSGGCIEDDLIYRVRTGSRAAILPECVTYGISAEEARRFGLPCGGTIQLVVDPLRQVHTIAEMLVRIENRVLFARELDMKTGASLFRPAVPTESLTFNGERLVSIHGPRYRLLLIGAGAMSNFLAEIAVALDYQVTVCDPREEYTANWNVPGATLAQTMPDDTVAEMRPDARTAVIALTHDPKLDDLALMEALKSDAFYVGAIGSRANNQKRRERLKEFDLDEQQLCSLHGPVGIYIGSKTPHEIAIAILAELTAVRNGVTLPMELGVEFAKGGSKSVLCSTAEV